MDEDLPRPRSRDRVVGEWVWSGQVPWLPSEHPVHDEMLGVMERAFPKPQSERPPPPPPFLLAREKQKQVSFNLTSGHSSSQDTSGAQQTLEQWKESESNDQTVDESADKTRPNSSQASVVRTRHSSLIDLPIDTDEYYHSLTGLYLKRLSSVPVLETIDVSSHVPAGQFEYLQGASSNANSLQLPASLAQRIPAPPRGILIRRPSSDIPWSITATCGPSDNDSYFQTDQEECQALDLTKSGQPKPYSGAMAPQEAPKPQRLNPGSQISLPEPSFRIASGLSGIYFPNLKSNQLASNQTSTHFLPQTQTGIAQPVIKPFSERSKQPISPSKHISTLPSRDKKYQTHSKTISALPFPVELPSQTLNRFPSQIVEEYPDNAIKQYSNNIIRRLSQAPNQLPRQPSNQLYIQPPNHPSSQPSNERHSQPSSQTPSRPPSQPPNQPTCQPPNQPTCQPPSQSINQPPNQPYSQLPRQTLSQYPSHLSTDEPNNQSIRQRISLLPRQSCTQTSAQSPCQQWGQDSRQSLKLPHRQPSIQHYGQSLKLPYDQPPGQHSGQILKLPYGQLSNHLARSSISQTESRTHPDSGNLMKPALSCLEKLLLDKSTTFSKKEFQNSDQAALRADSQPYRSLSDDRSPAGTAYRSESEVARHSLPEDVPIAPAVLIVSQAVEPLETLRALALPDSSRQLMAGAKQENTRDSQSTPKVKRPTGSQSIRSRSPLVQAQSPSKQYERPLVDSRHGGGQVTPAASNIRTSGQHCAPNATTTTSVGPTGSEGDQYASLHQPCIDLTSASIDENTRSVQYIGIPCCYCKDAHTEKDLTDTSHSGSLSELPFENLPLKKRYTRNPHEQTSEMGFQYQQVSPPVSQRFSTEASGVLEAPPSPEHLDINASGTRKQANATQTEECSAVQNVEEFYRLDISPFKASSSRDGALPQRPLALGEYSLHTRNLDTETSLDEKRPKQRNRSESLRNSGKKSNSHVRHKSDSHVRHKSDSQSGQKSKSPRKRQKSADRRKLRSSGERQWSDGQNCKGHSSDVKHSLTPERAHDEGQLASSSHHYVDEASTRQSEHENDVIKTVQHNKLEFPGTAADESRGKDLFPLDVTGVRAMIADLDRTFGDLGHQTESRGQPEDKSRISEGETTETASETEN